MKLQKLIILVSIFIILEIITFFILKNNYLEDKESIFHSTNRHIETKFQTISNSFNNIADLTYNSYLNNPKIKTLFKNKKRDELYYALRDDYFYLKSLGFNQLHFHLPNNESFLRMHKRYKFGDNLTYTRYSVSSVNKLKKPVLGGFETGMIIPGFRYVYPLYDGKEYLGSVENSFDIKTFIDSFEDVYSADTYFIIKRELFDKKIAKRFKTKYFDIEESNKYKMIVNKSRENLFNRNIIMKNISQENKTLINEQLQKEKTFTFYDNNAKLMITYLAVHNIKGTHCGYFIVYSQDNTISKLNYERFQNFFIISIIFLMIIGAIYKDMLDKIRLNKIINEKTVELKEINKNLEVKIYEQVKELRDKDATLLQQSRMADLGQMIANIAHQLKQPINTLKILIDSAEIRASMGEKISINTLSKDLNTQLSFMNDTIDLFRNFFNPIKLKEKNNVNYVVKSTLYITKGVYFDRDIIFKEADLTSKVEMYPNEIIQVIVNILKNAKDIQDEKNLEDKIIIIKTKEKNNYQYITIHDNAGGIPEDIIDRIFDQYFTTKGEKKGTGIGLNLAKQIIEEKHNGILKVVNSDFTHKNITYTGAKFTIKLPII